MARSSETWWTTADGRRIRLDRMSDDELQEAMVVLLSGPLDLPGGLALYDAVSVEMKVRQALRLARHPEWRADPRAA